MRYAFLLLLSSRDNFIALIFLLGVLLLGRFFAWLGDFEDRKELLRKAEVLRKVRQ